MVLIVTDEPTPKLDLTAIFLEGFANTLDLLWSWIAANPLPFLGFGALLVIAAWVSKAPRRRRR